MPALASSRAEATPAGVASRRVTSSLLELADRTFKHWSLLPAVLIFLVLTVYPMANLLLMSVSTIEFLHGEDIWTFDPGHNASELIRDRVLPDALRNTIVFVVVVVAVEVVIGLALAILVSWVPRAKGFLRTTMILPLLVPPVAIGSMWKLMYNFEFGVFNQLLDVVGLPPINWLGSTSLALWSVILVDVWHWVPFVFLILFAAVEGLPPEVLEAAHVDGATTWQIVRRIMIPMLMPAILVAVLFRGIHAFKTFDEVYLLTSGGPGTATEIASLHLYKVFFEQNQLGYGALLSLTLIAMVAAFLLVSRQTVSKVTQT